MKKTTININNSWKIEVDDWNHILYHWEEAKPKRKEGEMTKAGWQFVGYFPNVPAALLRATHLEMVDSQEQYELQSYFNQYSKVWNTLLEEARQ